MAEGVEFRLADAVVVRPGDTLVVSVPRHLSAAEADELSASMRESLPGVKLVVIDQCTGLAVYRPEAEAADPVSV